MNNQQSGRADFQNGTGLGLKKNKQHHFCNNMDGLSALFCCVILGVCIWRGWTNALLIMFGLTLLDHQYAIEQLQSQIWALNGSIPLK
jgi:hypothetical protein